MSLPDVDLAYFAGMLDGEGSIKLAKTKDKFGVAKHVVLSICVSNNDYGVLEEFKQAFGGVISERNRQNSPKWAPNWRPAFRWTRNGKRAAEVLNQLLPYLRIKKQHAEAAITFAETIHGQWKNKRHLTVEGQVLRSIAIRALREATAKLTHKGAQWVS